MEKGMEREKEKGISGKKRGGYSEKERGYREKRRKYREKREGNFIGKREKGI